jgi:hypothetical protein
VVDYFDLKDPKKVFEFVFQLYNFVSLANEDNNSLDDSFTKVTKLCLDVRERELPALATLCGKRKTRDNDDMGTGSFKRSNNAGGPVESDILSDVAILEALERAGYTLEPEVEGFTALLPVCGLLSTKRATIDLCP